VRDGVDVNGGKWVFVGGGFLGSFINERMLWLLTSQCTVTTCIILRFFCNQKLVGRDNGCQAHALPCYYYYYYYYYYV
jgi:hypothetical protein